MRRIALFALIAAAGCGEEATPEVVHERITRLVPPLVDGVVAAVDTVQNAPGLAIVGRVLGRLDTMVGKPDSAEPITGADLARKLNEEVFVQEAYEGEGIYRVDDDLRVQVEVDGNGLGFTLLTGTRAPVTIHLQSEAVTATLEVAELPFEATVAQGRASLRLGRLNDHAWTATISVDEAIYFQGRGFTVAVPAGAPLASATVDLTAGTLGATVDVGQVTLAMPWDGAVLGLELGGLTADLSLGDALSVRRLGFGPTSSKVTLDGQTLLALDWNPEAGRVVDLVVGTFLDIDAVAFAPRLTVDLTAHLQPLLAHVKVVPDWLVDELYELRFGPGFAWIGGGIEVMFEPLSISARKAAANLTVPEGMCIYADPLTAGEQPLIGRLAARACPAD
jgi:hypothetical protein